MAIEASKPVAARRTHLRLAHPEQHERLGRFVLHERIATGGMAEIHLARAEGPLGFTKAVVIKRLLPHLQNDEQFTRMFMNEARLAALLEHPNLVAVQELGVEPEYFMAMEFLDGCNVLRLARAFSRPPLVGEPVPVGAWAEILARACDGLHFAHELCTHDGKPLNIVHRDVSLENIVVTYGGQVKVIDFGVAKAEGMDGRTAVGQVKGKFGYMPPEVLIGQKIDRRADVWALGVCFYRLLSGMRPFSGRSPTEVLQRVLTVVPPRLESVAPGVPRELARIAHKALEKDRDRRYATAQDMQRDLLGWLAAHPARRVDLAQFVAHAVPKEQAPGEPGEPSSRRAVRAIHEAFPVSEDLVIEHADPISTVSMPGDAVVRPISPSAPLARRAFAWALEVALLAVLFRFTYRDLFWMPALFFLCVSTLTLRYFGASPGERLLGLELEKKDGARQDVGRGLARLAIQHGWLFISSAFIWAAYAASPASEALGIAALTASALTMGSGAASLFASGRTIHDAVTGTVVVPSRRST